jgi:hypothetical protein
VAAPAHSDTGAIEERRVALGIAHHIVAGSGQDEVAESPHPRREQSAAGAASRVEQRAQPGSGDVRHRVADLKQPAALRALGPAVRLGELSAARSAELHAGVLA